MGEWATLTIAALLMPLMDIALRLWGFRALYARLSSWSPTPGDDPESLTDGQLVQMARMVNAAANHGPWRATCLRRSMLLWWMLRWRGVISELKIGVLREDGEFKAHAWVECRGIVLNDRPNIGEHFMVLNAKRSTAGMTWV